MLNPMRDKSWRHVPGGRRDDTCDHGLSRRSLRVNKTSYELSWKVKVIKNIYTPEFILLILLLCPYLDTLGHKLERARGIRRLLHIDIYVYLWYVSFPKNKQQKHHPRFHKLSQSRSPRSSTYSWCVWACHWYISSTPNQCPCRFFLHARHLILTETQALWSQDHDTDTIKYHGTL